MSPLAVLTNNPTNMGRILGHTGLTACKKLKVIGVGGSKWFGPTLAVHLGLRTAKMILRTSGVLAMAEGKHD